MIGVTKYIYKASKPFVKYITIKSCQGIGYLSNKVVENLKDESIDNNKIGDNFFCVNDYVFNQSNEFPTFDEVTKGQDQVVNITEEYNNGNQNNNFNNQINNNLNKYIENYENFQQVNFNNNNIINNNINQNNDDNFNIIKDDDYIITKGIQNDKNVNVYNDNEKNK